ncbi:reverse transcriptase domain-containing protein [Tanacetum coccineum]
MEAQCLEVYMDSLLIANQVKGLYEAREDIMRRYLAKVRELQGHYNNFTMTQIPMLKNKCADALSKLASSSFAHLTKSVLVEVVPCQSIKVKAINTIEKVGPVHADYVLRETHLGSCGAHTEPRSIAQKASSKARLLLAYNVSGCNSNSRNMPQMSTTRTDNTPTAMRNDEHLKPFAILPVGNRHRLIISDNEQSFPTMVQGTGNQAEIHISRPPISKRTD